MNNVEISVGVKPIPMNFKRLLVPLLLAAIVLLGGALRLNGLEWDQRSGYHPDERFITMVTSGMKWPTSVAQFLNPKQSPLNPYWNAAENREQAFAYGTLPVYLTKAASEIMGKLVDKKWAEYGWNMIVGRAISGILDTLAILVLFLIGRKVFGNAVGLLAAALYAVTTLSIQHSHFYTTDITLNFFVLLAIYFALEMVKRGDILSGFATGAAIGMALASKISAAPLVLVAPVALLLHMRKTGARFQVSSLVKLLPALIAAAAGTIVLHFIFAPYTFLDLQGLLRNVKEQNDILISGISDRPFVRQYYNTTPYLYPIEQMVRWSLGWPLGITSLMGLGLIAFYAVRGKRHAALATLTLAWVVPYFVITGGSQAKFLRYMLPVLPLLALCAAVLLMRLIQAARARAATRPGTGASALRVGAYALAALVLAGTAWWAIAFSRIYADPHTANKASDWINANVPKDAVIAMEHWEEGIANLRDYKNPPGQIQLLSYEEDTPAKVKMYAAALSKADYIVNFSSRLYGTVPRITDRYPMSAEFYKKLFSGELGYELVFYSQSFPQALGVGVFEDTFTRPNLPRPAPLQTLNFAPIVINGGFADESFSAYDHPLTLVWKKTRPVTAQEVEAALTPLVPSQPWNPQLAKANNRQPLLSEAQAAADTAAGTFTELFDPNSLINQMPLLFWVMALALFTLVGLPIALLVGRSLPDRAYIFSPVIGLLVVGWLVWMPVSLGLVPYTRAVIFAALAVGLALAGWLFWRNKTEMLGWLRANLKLIALNEMLWILAFAAFLWVRMNNPDLWHPGRGGEKPMDFAYLMATIKSVTMPPYDPWFAGGYINYYYYGQYLVSIPIKLLGVLPEVAYNLAIPTLFAMTFAGAWSMGYNLVALFARRSMAVFGGLTSGLMMAVLGNMDSGARIFRKLVSIGGPGNLPEQAVYTLPFGDTLTRFLGGLGKLISGGEKVLQLGADWYWQPSRIYTDSGSIQEFPYFTYLYSDLHAHLIAMPFALLVAALALCLALSVRERGGKTFATWQESLRDAFALPHVLRVALAGLALGALWTINSWDYPGYALLIGVTMLAAWWPSRDAKHLAFTLISGGSVAALSYALYLPFHRAFVQGYTGFHTHTERSPLTGFLAMFFAFLFAVVSWAIYTLVNKQRSGSERPILFQSSRAAVSKQAAPARRAGAGPLRAFNMLRGKPDQLRHILLLMAALEHKAPALKDVADYDGSAIPAGAAGATETPSAAPLSQTARMALAVGALIFLAALARALLGAVGPVATFAALMTLVMLFIAFTRKTLAESFAAGAAAIAFIGIGFVDNWALEGDIGRMNTVFKFYLQAWTLLSIAAGFGAAVILSARAKVPRVMWAAAFGVLLVGAATYPVFATSARFRDRWDEKQAPTLNGTQYMQTMTYVDEANINNKVTQGQFKLSDDLAAITWMRANIPGSPVVLEAPSGPPPHPRLYSWGGRVSIYTGLPSLVGWDWHQRQQRLGVIDIERRVNDALVIYTAPDLAQSQKLLKDYGVSYVYYGGVEKLHYPAGEAKLAGMAAGGMLEQVYAGPNTTIYKVVK